MQRNRPGRLIPLVLANVLLPIALFVFATGFFPYKPFLSGLADFEEVKDLGLGDGRPEAIFDRVVFMVVDALRSDFLYGQSSGFTFTQSLIRSGAAIPFTAHATSPTVTMPRIKALTTGSVPSFVDMILNFAESDTTSSLATQDTWLAQLRARGGKLVFYGDDTWLKLFPGDFFVRSDGTSSFFVSDFTEVDNNVTRHVPDELAQSDWNAMIMHYLGLDHIGHKAGPNSPNMLPKQQEMDSIVRLIYEAMESSDHHANTLLILAGDHGMNAGGNHGGSGPGETEPALVLASPKFKSMKDVDHRDCPASPEEGTEFRYYDFIEQSDLVPTLAALMGMPVSRNSLGILARQVLGLWQPHQRCELLYQNAKQVLGIVHAAFGAATFQDQVASNQRTEEISDFITCEGKSEGLEGLACRWSQVEHLTGRAKTDSERLSRTLHEFLLAAQETMSSAAGSYDVSRLAFGSVLSAVALVLAIASSTSLWPPSTAGIYCTTLSLLYGIIMFASSYVEEEQHFWYWATSAWFLVLAVKSTQAARHDGHSSRQARIAFSALSLLVLHRLSSRWNQTGQKHAGAPDIAHSFFPAHHILLWLLVLSSYCHTTFQLINQTFAGFFPSEIAIMAAVVLTLPAVVFKLNFTQADAPELVGGLAEQIRDWSKTFDLVLQARLVFVLLTMSAMTVVVLSLGVARMRDRSSAAFESLVTMPHRLHGLLTLFLMTQTRVQNIPLFLVFELQRQLLSTLTDPDAPREPSDNSVPERKGRALTIAMTTLLLSHVSYYCFGGSNAISSIDLSNAYNGVAGYNVAAVGVLLFCSNWAGPVWWCSAGVLLLLPAPSTILPKAENTETDGARDWVQAERNMLQKSVMPKKRLAARWEVGGDWQDYVRTMTVFVASSLLAVMAACTALRTHLFIWTVFSPKYLYAMAWCIGWHLGVNVGLGSLLHWLGRVA